MTPIRLYLEIAAAIVLCAAFALFVHHERVVGEQKIEVSDAKALDAAKKAADIETALNIARATKADAGADHDQQIIDDYRTAHPEQPVRLCHAANGSQPAMPTGEAPHGGPPGAGSSPDLIRAVQDRTAGPDIGPGIDALVQAAGRLATLYTDRQSR